MHRVNITGFSYLLDLYIYINAKSIIVNYRPNLNVLFSDRTVNLLPRYFFFEFLNLRSVEILVVNPIAFDGTRLTRVDLFVD